MNPKRIQLILHLKKLTFYTVFLLLFCLSFALSIITNFGYRAATVSLLIIPLLFIHGFKIDKIFTLYCFLAIIVTASGIYNNTPIINIILFMRILVFSYLIYYLTKATASPTLMISAIKLSISIAMIQLPIILLQWWVYNILPMRWRGNAVVEDFGSGTFNYKTDYAMVFFLTLIITFLLFEKKRSYFVKNKFLICTWLSFTILIANSQIMKLVIILIWATYLIINFRVKNLVIVGVSAIITVSSLVYFSKNNLITEEITLFLYRLNDYGNTNVYLSGGYSRAAAIRYLASEGFTWLGNGPSKFSDPLSRTITRGNTGHSFTFFSEIGFLGWIISLAILFFIAFPKKNNGILISWLRVISFVAILVLSFTAQVMNDMAVFFIYCIVLQTNKIPEALPYTRTNKPSNLF